MSKMIQPFKQNKNVGRKDTSILDFIIGMVLVTGGLYFIFKNTSIGVSWVSRLWGTNLPSGVITIPILTGVILLLIQMVLGLKITFGTTNLLDYFLMFGGTFGGLGLLARALLR